MWNRKNDTVVLSDARPIYKFDTILCLCFLSVHPRVVNVNADAEFIKLGNDIYHASIAQIGTIFLECQSKDQHPRAVDLKLALEHLFDEPSDNVSPHAIINSASRKNHFRMVTDCLSFVC